jgi:hypothetical protein
MLVLYRQPPTELALSDTSPDWLSRAGLSLITLNFTTSIMAKRSEILLRRLTFWSSPSGFVLSRSGH